MSGESLEPVQGARWSRPPMPDTSPFHRIPATDCMSCPVLFPRRNHGYMSPSIGVSELGRSIVTRKMPLSPFRSLAFCCRNRT